MWKFCLGGVSSWWLGVILLFVKLVIDIIKCWISFLFISMWLIVVLFVDEFLINDVFIVGLLVLRGLGVDLIDFGRGLILFFFFSLIVGVGWVGLKILGFWGLVIFGLVILVLGVIVGLGLFLLG